MTEIHLPCVGCGQPIIEGMHFMGCDIKLDTLMPEDWEAVHSVEPTALFGNVHSPTCLFLWLASHEIIQDAFGR